VPPDLLSSLKSPTIADIEALAEIAWRRLPETFRAMAAGVVIQVVDLAEDDVLKELDIDSPFDLLGLYQGVALAQKTSGHVPRGPDYVFLYRRALLDYWAEHDEALGDLVTHVLVHEIGHHFGLSDADMDAIEASATGSMARS
jgi:predicted Zn-dependent protease with MMP-like domain